MLEELELENVTWIHSPVVSFTFTHTRNSTTWSCSRKEFCEEPRNGRLLWAGRLWTGAATLHVAFKSVFVLWGRGWRRGRRSPECSSYSLLSLIGKFPSVMER